MKTAWNDVNQVAAQACHGVDNSARLTNLCILSALAFDRGLIANQNRWNDGTLRISLERLALSPLPTLSSSKTWASLASLAKRAAERIATAGGADQLVSAFQSADTQQKTRGAYATPSAFSEIIARVTLLPLVNKNSPPSVIDPSAGAGAFLTAAIKILGHGTTNEELRSIVYAMHGVEIDPAARELCCLLIWIDAARAKPELRRIAENVVVGNALTRDWHDQSGRFDALLMNPPWESLRHAIAGNDSLARQREETIGRLNTSEILAHDLPPLFSAQGAGDKNLFKAFVELAPHLIRESGRIGALIPAAFASDLGLAALRRRYLEHFQLDSWTAFENRRRYFPIDTRYKFGVLIGTRSASPTAGLSVRSFATEPYEVEAEHVSLTRGMIDQFGGTSRMIPELKDDIEVQVMRCMFEHGTPFFSLGALGLVRYRREIDLTLGRFAKKFDRADSYTQLQRNIDGSYCSPEGVILTPLLEGRMVGRYDPFQKSWRGGSGRTAKWEMNGPRPLGQCTPQFLIEACKPTPSRLAICDVTSATNTRTVHATLVPDTWTCGNTAPVLTFQSHEFAAAALGILNSMVFDWMVRRLVGGLHLNKFYLSSFVWPAVGLQAINRIGKLVAKITQQKPRSISYAGGVVAREDAAKDPQNLARLEAELEKEVALGFGLDTEMLACILSTDRSDRRGFWRYFDANPAIQKAVHDMLSEYYLEQPLRISAVA